MKNIILASASPRRRELLKRIVSQFDVVVSEYAEEETSLDAKGTVTLFAREKAREVFSRFPNSAVIGADTVVSLDGTVLGKPQDKEDAKRMLRRMSGRTHEVMTGVTLIVDGRERSFVSVSRVTFLPLSEEVISAYVESGLPLDKAGAYGIQDGYPLVKEYEGSYTNIVGFPVEDVRTLLQEEKLC